MEQFESETNHLNDSNIDQTERMSFEQQLLGDELPPLRTKFDNKKRTETIEDNILIDKIAQKVEAKLQEYLKNRSKEPSSAGRDEEIKNQPQIRPSSSEHENDKNEVAIDLENPSILKFGSLIYI